MKPLNNLPSKHRPNSSRKGCWTCKRLHRTCDESLPLCKKCESFGVECEGYGVKRVAFRSSKHDPSNKVAKQCRRRKDVSLSRSPDRLYGAIAVSPMPADHREQSLLNYFIENFAPLRRLSPIQNIFEEDIAPLAFSHDHVRTAILAVASASLSPGKLNAEAFGHYTKSIRVLRVSLEVQLNATSSADIDASLASMYLLTWFEVLTFDPAKWAIHLNALCQMINSHRKSLWKTTFGRRLLHAVSRLDCQNALSNRGKPMLDLSLYRILETESPTPPQDEPNSFEYFESVAIESCRRLHGILGMAAFLSHEWTNTPPKTLRADFQQRIVNVLHQLDEWYCSLPHQLQWPGRFSAVTTNSHIIFGTNIPGNLKQPEEFHDENEEDMEIVDIALRYRSHLQKAILLQYFAIQVHIYHILDPIRDPELMRASAAMSQICIRLIRAFESSDLSPSPSSASASIPGSPPSPLQSLPSLSDMPMCFIFAVIGVLVQDDSQRRWISNYLFRLGREGIWCGYERALCLQAWWKSAQKLGWNVWNMKHDNQKRMTDQTETCTKRMIKSIPLREEIPMTSNWTPDMGMGVEILYEDIRTGERATDKYFLDGRTY